MPTSDSDILRGDTVSSESRIVMSDDQTLALSSRQDGDGTETRPDNPSHKATSEPSISNQLLNLNLNAKDKTHSDPSLTLQRRGRIVFGEDEEPGAPTGSASKTSSGLLSRVISGEQIDLGHNATLDAERLVETVIEWKQGGQQVYVTGSFTEWRQMIPLRKVDSELFAVVIKLSPGMHRLRFVVDGELRCSDHMDTATDSMGNLVNYMEVIDTKASSEFVRMEQGEVILPPHYTYTKEIPAVFVEPEALDRLASSEFVTPPQLPPHLDGIILNTNWNDKDNNSVLPIPNHVVLNHLATTSIRHNVLAVASISRYSAKYVTQVLYTPL